ncbi:MAG: serine hydrolase domain-containing protein [Gemmatimonadota bacterium]
MTKHRGVPRLSALVLACLSFPAIAQAQQTYPRDARVDRLMNAAIDSSSPGAAVIVIHHGLVVHAAAYGLADIEARRPNRVESMFHMASTGKQFTALSVLMLSEQGKVSLDDPIGKHFPGLARFGSKLTVRQMLHHTSGIPDYYDDSTGYRKLLAMNPEPTNSDIVHLYADWGTARPAGVKFVYSNAGFDLLGSLVEKLSGQSLDAFLQEHVFGPAGMPSSFSLWNPVRFADTMRSRGYDRKGSGWVVDDVDPLDHLVGSGSVYSSVVDLFHYDQALYSNQLVRQSTLAQAFEPIRLANGQLEPYGFGWRLDERSGIHYLHHGGAWEGYLSHILRIPDRQFSIFILQNRTDLDPGKFALAIFDLYRASLD